MKQADLGLDLTSRKTRKGKFLDEMERVVPWAQLLALIEPHAPRKERGRPPFGAEVMLRIHFLQQWFGLSDVAMEEALFDVPLYRQFAGLGGMNRLPDRVSILRFRHLLEQHELAPKMLEAVNATLAAKGLMLKEGTAVDASLIAAPSSTKNNTGTRDPEMHQTKKGNQWYFGMKVHIGVDSRSGLTHSASITSANVHDSRELPNLLHGKETRLYGDSAYTGQKDVLKEIAPNAKDFTNKRARRNHPLTDADKETNRRKSQVRARVEHPFRPLKSIYGFAKVRYRGLVKNANRALALLALINLEKWGRPLTGQVRPA